MPVLQMNSLTHLDHNGRARMVDVSAKSPTPRHAKVQCVVRLSPDAFQAMLQENLEKGDPFTVAKLAGIQAAKRTAELIPLCHPLPLEHLDVSFEPDPARCAIRLVAETTATTKTGVEMEAFVAASIGALALYDMVKAIDPGATITDLQLVGKTGGKQAFQGTSRCAPPL